MASRKKNQRRRHLDIAIGEMELEDLSEVFALGEELFTAEEWPILYRTWDEYELVEMFGSDGETCLVAEHNERIVGFVLGTLIEKRRGAWSYGYLVWLGVDPEYNRSGVGTQLTEELTRVFIELGARMMIVDTEAENDAAVKFFIKHGFGDETDHVYLSKNLTRDPRYLRRKKKGASGSKRGGRKHPSGYKLASPAKTKKRKKKSS
ncbi:GNAT family N-acetyltransferase [candidate division KSB1 bacterium]|nr:GNAT family N-acetyltransferase [candidate division KSB1 bacterium]NIR70631.1 GNAT family N-acetyltransferase [candidate division KSB1 bacterium]NIS27734.1 GNAT family N-acetyltransferase [candidate division KSB1 bacterium]NIT74569.1 GNAT family N-acetyltransferase [candidate division KSB1 bacterium]NIU28401.1 GNAT family N-acetyltransferase [candidate division KSB1 bacterium]